jgi:hypothetical protein
MSYLEEPDNEGHEVLKIPKYRMLYKDIEDSKVQKIIECKYNSS